MPGNCQKGFMHAGLLVMLILVIVGVSIYLIFSKNNSQPKSTITWSSKVAQQLKSGDKISGKGIPNAKVQLISQGLSPDLFVQVDQQGIWSYQLPADLAAGNYKIIVKVLDKGGTVVAEKTLQVNIAEKKSIFSFLQPKSVSAAELITEFPYDRYQKYGFPKPNGEFTALTDGEIYRWKKYYLPYAVNAAKMTDIDVGLLGMWVYWETYMSTYFDNCFDGNKSTDPLSDLNQNTYCPGWYLFKDGKERPNWQLGWGIYAYEAGEQFRSEFPGIIKTLHPNETIQQIGQKVIEDSKRQDTYSEKNFLRFSPPNDPITNPSTFPDVPLEQILDGAQPKGGGDPNTRQDAKDPNMRQLLGILLKDQAIGAYMLARHFKEAEKETNGRIVGDSQYWFKEAQDLQKSVNLIATLYSYSFDAETLTILSAQETSGDGVISPGEKIDVVSACSRDSWQIDQEYCEVYYEFLRLGGPDVRLINPKPAFAQEEEQFPETISELHPVTGGSNCDQECSITVPADAQPGTYKLIAYATDKGEQKIVASDSVELQVGGNADQRTTSGSQQSATNSAQQSDPGPQTDTDWAKKCGFAINEDAATIPFFKFGLGENSSITDQSCKDLLTKIINDFQTAQRAAASKLNDVVGKVSGGKAEVKNVNGNYEIQGDASAVDQGTKDAVAKLNESQKKVDACEGKSNEELAQCLKGIHTDVQATVNAAQIEALKIYYQKFKRIVIDGNIPEGTTNCVKADLGVAPFMDSEGINHPGEEYRLLVCRKSGENKVKWRVLVGGEANAGGDGDADKGNDAERLAKLHPTGTGDPVFPVKINTCVTLTSNEIGKIEDILRPYVDAAQNGNPNVSSQCQRIRNPNDTDDNSRTTTSTPPEPQPTSDPTPCPGNVCF